MKTINGATFRRMCILACNRLNAQCKVVDDLNVFPVPDGDTGTNMNNTLVSATRRLLECQETDLSSVSESYCSGAIRGAKGNSGAILSQIIRGMSRELRDAGDEADGFSFANALSSGREAAYKAVQKPREGTILSIISALAEAAGVAAQEHEDLEKILAYACERGEEALAYTPEQLPILKKAGVVDAGGKGLLIIFEAFREALENPDLTEEPCFLRAGGQAQSTQTEQKTSGKAQAVLNTEDITFAYCTEFIAEHIKNAEALEDELRAFFSKLGDSLVLVIDGDLVKVHVHTNDPGVVLQKATSLGEVTSAKIDNMRLQHRTLLEEEEEAASAETSGAVEISKKYGFVSIAAGDGLKEVFEGLGVDVVVSGGQTMNPSTDDILTAAEQVPAETVFILPNNKNIIMSAQQAAELSAERKIIVIPSVSVPQGVTALMNFVPTENAEDAAKLMMDSLPKVVSASVTFAVRDTAIDDLEIKENDILALLNGKIVHSGKDLYGETCQLLDDMLEVRSDYISIYYGEGATEESAQALSDYIMQKCPTADVSVLWGGQPLYYYIISAE